MAGRPDRAVAAAALAKRRRFGDSSRRMPVLVPVLSAPAEWTAELVAGVDASALGLLGPTGSRLVIDLSRTTFLASVGLTFLIRLGKRLSEAGGGIALAAATPAIVKLLRAIGLTRVLPLFHTVEEARAHLSVVRPAPGRP